MIPKIFLLAALSASIFGWAQYQKQGSDVRMAAAADWSVDGTQFVATGMASETLLIKVSDEDPVMCDVYVDNILTGKDMMWLVKSRGFTKLQCGDRIEVLK